jgi:hypothetical protein
LCWAACDVSGPNSRLEPKTLIEAMNTRILSSALKQDVVAIASPRLAKCSLNDCATMPLPTMLRVGYNILEKSMSAPAA